ncbi:MAG: hypothetical protein NTW86_06030 [Candidatus Sumerlaeota bacterium]|nr:hypothetical protein [Candidatus Sumerlaeota bacterium]
MLTAEHLAQSITLDRKGVHLLLWQDKEDLYRAMIVLLAALGETPIQPILVASADSAVSTLRDLFQTKASDFEQVEHSDEAPRPNRGKLIILFLQQAISETFGPWLNGWRSELAKAPGTLLVVRNADFIDFQRCAPDLASFIGPKIFDASAMLSIWSRETEKRLRSSPPKQYLEILRELPGRFPDPKEVRNWIRGHSAL